MTLSVRKGDSPAVPSWSQQEIEAAQARCAVLLKGLSVVATPEVPMREGKECGAPAPMRLVSIGKGQPVAFTPPPVVTCDLIAAIAEWLDKDVQPLARKHLGGPVTRIQTMSSYSCRNAYGRAHGRLSEHGKANALDIGSFVTARGQAAMVIADWGPTARQIAAQARAAAAAEAADAALDTPAAKGNAVAQPAVTPASGEIGARRSGLAAPKQAPPAATASTIAPLDLRAGLVVGIPGVILQGARLTPQSGPSLGLEAPSRLGGPKPPPEAPDKALARPVAKAPASHPEGKTDFLRAVHKAACVRFMTALGPEANHAHHNHFHIDMAERIKNTKVCD